MKLVKKSYSHPNKFDFNESNQIEVRDSLANNLL